MAKHKSFIGVLVSLILIVTLLCGIGLLVYLLNKGTASFYVTHGGAQYTYKTSDVVLPKNEYLFFYCKGDFVSKDKIEDFAVSIIPAEGVEDFNFKVDGQTYQFKSERDLSVGFDIRKYDNYFIIYLPEGLTMQSVLQAAYKGYTVSDVPSIDVYVKDYFAILVYSERSNASVNISFH